MRILNAEYVKGTLEPENRRMSNIPEVCFIGRSNVGKSSMINTLVMQKVARTSSTPGATRLINLYSIDYEYRGVRQQLIFSDFPGFGYSKVSKVMQQNWQKMIEGYIERNKNIKRIIWVYDARREFDNLDEMLLEWFFDRKLHFTLVLTKTDKESRNFVDIKKRLSRQWIGEGEIFTFSAKTGEGRKELLSHIFSTADT